MEPQPLFLIDMHVVFDGYISCQFFWIGNSPFLSARCDFCDHRQLTHFNFIWIRYLRNDCFKIFGIKDITTPTQSLRLQVTLCHKERFDSVERHFGTSRFKMPLEVRTKSDEFFWHDFAWTTQIDVLDNQNHWILKQVWNFVKSFAIKF